MKIDLDSQEIQLVRVSLMCLRKQHEDILKVFTREDTKELVKEDIKKCDALIKRLEE